MANRVIVITGANGGLGRALAQMFDSDGEHVVLLGRTLSKVAEVAAELSDRAMAAECDVTSPESVRAAFAAIATRHPKIDVLINNAAIFEPFLIEEASDDQLMRGVLTNLLGPMLCSRAAIPVLNRGGHIINVSSESVALPFPHLLVYVSTKAGLERFAEGLHDELEDKGIRVSVMRAGQMFGPGSSAAMEPVAAGRFMEAAAARGLNLMQRGVTSYASAAAMFRNLVNLPPDMHVGQVAFRSRRPE